jgi:hypothetical protein
VVETTFSLWCQTSWATSQSTAIFILVTVRTWNSYFCSQIFQTLFIVLKTYTNQHVVCNFIRPVK